MLRLASFASIAASTRGGDIGNSVNRIPMALSTAFAIAAIGGTITVPAVPNYMIGYANGAKSVKPDIKVELQYVSAAADKAAFNDPPGGTAFAKLLLRNFPDVDVIFQVAGATGNGVLQAACEAGIYGIGVDVDQYVSVPDNAKCTIVSAEKKLKKNVSDIIQQIDAGTYKAGTNRLDITTDDVGLSSFHEHESLITADTNSSIPIGSIEPARCEIRRPPRPSDTIGTNSSPSSTISTSFAAWYSR